MAFPRSGFPGLPQRRWLFLFVLLAAVATTGLTLAMRIGGDEERREDPAARAEFDRLRLTGKRDGVYDPNLLLRAWRRVKTMRARPELWSPSAILASQTGASAIDISPAQWEQLGPGNVGGRVRSIVVNPQDPRIMVLGSVSGGIWRTTDGGASWTPFNDFLPSLGVGCMAMDPTNPNIIYAGTGEAFGDRRPGAGIFKTIDGGLSWNQLDSTGPNGWNWPFVNRISVSRANPSNILAATENGIWMSSDEGQFWTNTQFGAWGSVQWHPTDPDKAIASGYDGELYYTNSGSLGWTPATVFAGSQVTLHGRAEVAYAPSDPNHVYAIVNSGLGQVYHSWDGGQTFFLVNNTTSVLGGQGNYDNALWVDPTDHRNLLAGGVNLWKSTDQGTNWTFVSTPHPDFHIIVSDPLNPHKLYTGSDGGIHSVADFASNLSFSSLNHNLSITQFYGGAANRQTGFLMGGAQDNGTWAYNGRPNAWYGYINGIYDGGPVAVDPLPAGDGYTCWFTQSQGFSEWRTKLAPSGTSTIEEPLTFAGLESRSLFEPPKALDGTGTFYKGSGNLWRIKNACAAPTGTSTPWEKIKFEASSAAPLISAIAVDPTNPDVVFVGDEVGNIFATFEGSAPSPGWTEVTAGGKPWGDRYCTGIVVDPSPEFTPRLIYATFAGFDNNNVWWSGDSGFHWTRITTGLPPVTAYRVAIHPHVRGHIYVATELGVFASDQFGSDWSPTNNGPANIATTELFWQGNKLVASTYGRGMFRVNLNNSPSATITAPVNNATFPAGTDIWLVADATDFDGVAEKVEFYQGGVKIGEAVPGTRFTWMNVPVGSYTITARAVDDDHDTGPDSPPVTVTVTPPPPPTGLFPVADAYVKDGSAATTNFGTANPLEVKTSSTTGLNRDAYFKFSLSGLTGAVQSATLRIFANLSQAGSVVTTARGVSSTAWTESNITWNANRPSLAATLGSATINTTTGAWSELDVTSEVASALGRGSSTVTLALHNAATSTPIIRINSRESAANKPELSLVLAQPLALKALLVVGNTTLSAGDAAIKARLQNLGLTVTVKSHSSATAADADDKSLVFISSTVTASTVGAKFRNTGTSVVNCEQGVQDDLGMTGTASGTDFGTVSSQSQVKMLTSTHPLSAGLSGTQTVATTSGSLNWGKPNANAVRIASTTADASRVTDYGYDQGVAMSGLTAPGRRVQLFLTDATAANLTTSGKALFDAAVKWAAGL